MRTIIRAEELGKRYRRGAVAHTETLRDALTKLIHSPLTSARYETFWALRDVSLDVREGEILGLVGRNGAGKTTLLKILSRITRPTTGWADIHGRVRSLLEVGTGFHGELSGRENAYLSGSILGMSKREIDRKFEEIVAFAEIDGFIDTPVKHYSSGMYVRLAFAVAAHLEPEILLVDEVLAVGDINFQKKCLGKMGDVARQGRTIVLVSHNMAAINALCSRCVVMQKGRVAFDGSASEATARYYADSLARTTDGSDLSMVPRDGNGKAKFRSIVITPFSQGGDPLEAAQPGCDLRIEIEICCESDFSGCNLAVVFYDAGGYRVVDTNTAQKGEFVSMRAGQTARARFLLRDVLLKPGCYFVGLWLGREAMETVDDIRHATTIDFIETVEICQHSVIYPGIYLCRFEENVFVC